ncbi:MAG TPA: DJ-1/PfpI family protein [Candidatus Barnesiella excrementigallinarum]|nr:DJ-1/PfpI family protein [Candidatus Barnesiella excrementigallinarum]
MKTAYLFLATGFEEIEALTVIDMLRRAEIDVTTVSISRNLQVEGAHGVTVTADTTWVELSADDVDWLILPGGMPGTKHLGECKPLVSLLQRQAAAHKNIAAICAAPSVLGQAGLLNGYKATCYPGFEQFLNGATVTGEPVTIDRNIITANGPGAAIAFAAAIISQIAGKERAKEVTTGMML